MFGGKTERQRSANVHNDFIIDQLEGEGDYRALISLADSSIKLGRITELPTSYSDTQQRERRPDKVIKAEVLDADEKLIGEHIFLFEFKSWLIRMALLLQLLLYLAMLWARYRLPVTPVVIYTGSKRLRQEGDLSFRDYMRDRCPTLTERSVDFRAPLLNVLALSASVLQEKAGLLAPGLYLAPRIYDLNDEVIAEFLRMCAQLPAAQREQRLEKGCTFMLKYADGCDWQRLARIEQRTLPEEEWLMARVRFGREAAVEEAFAEGEARGRAEGEARGEARGRTEGIAEGGLAAQRDIALNLLKRGVAEVIICQTTKLSRKEVQLLKKSL